MAPQQPFAGNKSWVPSHSRNISLCNKLKVLTISRKDDAVRPKSDRPPSKLVTLRTGSAQPVWMADFRTQATAGGQSSTANSTGTTGICALDSADGTDRIKPPQHQQHRRHLYPQHEQHRRHQHKHQRQHWFRHHRRPRPRTRTSVQRR